MTSLRLALAGLAVAATSLACIDENILDPMADRQPAYRRYRESAFYADGQGMQAPPVGASRRTRRSRRDGCPTAPSSRTASRCLTT
jgi:hypothetical protein